MRLSFRSAMGRATGLITNPSSTVVATALLTNVVRLFSTVVLTRLLTATDYGAVGIILTLAAIVIMLSDFGFFSFVVKHADGNSPDFLDEIWTIRLIRSVVLTGVMVALAYPYAMFAGKLLLAPAIAVWAFTQLLEGLSSMAFAQAVRQGLVTRFCWMEFLVGLFQTVATIALAVWLRNYWAVVFAGLLGATAKIAFSYIIFPDSRRRWRFSMARQKEVWAFSRFIAGSSILTLLINQSDKVVLSRLLPLDLFGIYSIATLLALAPAALMYNYCMRILYPVYADHFRNKGIEGFANVYYAKRKLMSLLYCFAMGGLIGIANLVVAILYSDAYSGVAPLLQILAISTLLRFNNVSGEQAMIAIGQQRSSFHINGARVVWLLCAGAAGYFIIGPMGVIWAVGTVEVAAMVAVWWKLHRNGILRWRRELPSFAIAIAGCAIGLTITELAPMTGWL